MNKSEFIAEIKDILQTDEDITFESNLSDFDGWDSLATMSIVSMFDEKLNKEITLSMLDSIKKVGELAKLAGIQ